MADILDYTQNTEWAYADAIYLVDDATGTPADNYITLSDFFGQTIHIGDTVNSDMTLGLTINQGANDDEILAFKSSDIEHERATIAETDTYATFKKRSAGLGGLQIRAIGEDSVLSRVFELQAHGGTAATAKTSTGDAMIMMFAAEHDGADGYADVTSSGNVFGVIARVGAANRTIFLLDEDGDYHYDGADGGAFDDFDDVQLARTFDLVANPDTVIKDEWDSFIGYKEQDLVDAGILGAPVSQGGLVNGAQLQRLHNGAIVQLGKELTQVYKRLESYEKAMLKAGMEIPQLGA